jgi:hypothetical protein
VRSKGATQASLRWNDPPTAVQCLQPRLVSQSVFTCSAISEAISFGIQCRQLCTVRMARSAASRTDMHTATRELENEEQAMFGLVTALSIHPFTELPAKIT